MTARVVAPLVGDNIRVGAGEGALYRGQIAVEVRVRQQVVRRNATPDPGATLVHEVVVVCYTV